MKKSFTSVKTMMIALFTVIALNAAAATTPPATVPAPGPTPTTSPGPSDVTTAPPTLSTTPMPKIVCAGGVITVNLTSPAAPAGTYYNWYKINSANQSVLVARNTTGAAYTETAAGSGYYYYKLVLESAAGCISDESDIVKIFVLPSLAPTIPTPDPVCASNKTTTTLAIDPASLPAGYDYTYQWYRNGQKITDAHGTDATYTVSETGSTTTTTVGYSVDVAFKLNNTCSKTATATVTVSPLPAKPTIAAN